MPFSAAQETKRLTMSPADRTRADEEASAQRDPERRRDAGLDRADPLPRTLDATPHRGVEDAAAGDLEAREPCLVEDLGDAQDLGRGQAPGERLLREEPDRRVDELGHGLDLSDLSHAVDADEAASAPNGGCGLRRGRCSGLRADRP